MFNQAAVIERGSVGLPKQEKTPAEAPDGLSTAVGPEAANSCELAWNRQLQMQIDISLRKRLRPAAEQWTGAGVEILLPTALHPFGNPGGKPLAGRPTTQERNVSPFLAPSTVNGDARA
jgi:hypothetical protein